jgi:hypothetical protein
LVLADVETTWQLAADEASDERKRIMESFKTSDVFPLEINVVDMVS